MQNGVSLVKLVFGCAIIRSLNLKQEIYFDFANASLLVT
jgi:hypothetical protein